MESMRHTARQPDAGDRVGLEVGGIDDTRSLLSVAAS